MAYQMIYKGPAALARALVECLEDEGATVDWAPPDGTSTPGPATDYITSLAASGTIDSVTAGVAKFRERFGSRATVDLNPDDDEDR